MNNIPKKLIFMLVVAYLLIIFSGFSSNDVRRLVGLYPVIYLFSIFLLFNLKITERLRFNNFITGFFIILSLIHFLYKF